MPKRANSKLQSRKKIFGTYELSSKRQALRITCIYFLIGSLWIFLSDKLVEVLIKERSIIFVISLIKGWVYVLVTSLLIFLLVFNAVKKVAERKRSEEYINKLNNELENKVILRTSQLEEMNGVLGKANNMLSAILESSPEIIVFSLDSNCCYLAFNNKHKDTMRAIWGIEIELGMNLLDVIGRHEDHKKIKINFDRAFAGESFTLIEEYGNADFSRLICQDFWTPIFSTEGKVIGTTCFVLDVTERKRAEDLLKIERKRLENIIEGTNVGTWEWNVQTGETVFNDHWAKIIGYTLEEISPVSLETWTRFTHPEDLIKSDNQLNQVFAREIDYYDVECRMKHKDGSWVWIHDRGKVTAWTSDDKPLFMSGTHSDITERKLAEELMIRKNLFQKLIADISSDFINATVDNIDDKIKNMLKVSGEFFEVDKNCVFQISTDGRNMIITHEWCAGDSDSLTSYKKEVSFNDLPWWEEELRSYEPLHISDMDKLPEAATSEKELFKTSKIQSLLNIQITNNNRLIGALGYASIKEPKVWREDQIALLKVVANIVSDALTKNKMEKEILEAKEKAEKENSLKTEFFANMSHEFRTPLNVMLSTIQLFELYARNEENLTSEKTAEHLKAMKRNSFRLLRLVNNLIDVSKIDSGFYEPVFNNYNIVDVIEKIVLSIKEYANQKNIKVRFKSDLKENVIKCDVDMIERIMLNLISNAIKFSNENCYIHISITNKVDTIVISVKDNGIGIEEDKQGIIFERYKQASTTLSRMCEGSGIGLTLTKSLVEMHDGTINAKSEYGKGSEFIIKIPNVKCLNKEIIVSTFDDDDANLRFISKMNVEFSDIYL
ncbi:MAG TPA: ATP-binding protein [Clostridiaceae bacterium]